MTKSLNNPNAFSTQDEPENPAISPNQITDDSDYPHTGLIKALSLGVKGNYATTGFNVTNTTDDDITFADGVVFRDGEKIDVTGSTIVIGTTAGTTKSYTDGYHLVVNATGTTTLSVRPPTAANRVPAYTDGDVIIAVVVYTGNDPLQVQYLTVNKIKNSLSIGRDNSGYTEGLTIKNNAGDAEIEAKEQDKDIIFKVNDGGTPTEVMRIDGSESRVGIGTDSPTKKMEVKGDVHLSRSVDSGQTRILSLEGARNATGNDYARIDFQNYDSDGPTSYTGARISVKNEADGVNDGSMLFYTNNAASTLTERMRITDSGDVGIGTDSPSGTLHVKNSNTDYCALFESDDDGSSAAPDVALYRNGLTPANGDDLGHLIWRGTTDDGDSTVTRTNITDIFSELQVAATGTESGKMHLRTKKAGAMNKRISIEATKTVVNEDGVDVDFIVESDTNANMLVVDAGLNAIGIGKASPSATLDVSGNIEASTTINSGTSMLAGTSMTATTTVTGTTGLSTTGFYQNTNPTTILSGISATPTPISCVEQIYFIHEDPLAGSFVAVADPNAVAGNIVTLVNLQSTAITVSAQGGLGFGTGNAPAIPTYTLGIGNRVRMIAVTDGNLNIPAGGAQAAIVGPAWVIIGD